MNECKHTYILAPCFSYLNLYIIKYDDFQLHKRGDFEMLYLINEELRDSNTFQCLFEGGEGGGGGVESL